MVNMESSDTYSKEKGVECRESDEYQPSLESEMEDELADQEHDLHICKGYMQPEAHYVESIHGNRLRIICRHSCHTGTK